MRRPVSRAPFLFGGFSMTLQLLPDRFSVCQLSDACEANLKHPFTFLSITDDEISLVCPESEVPASTLRTESGWCAFRIVEMLDFSLTGILSGISAVLSEAKLSLFAISTYNTDYILIKESALTKSISVLENAGYEIKFL